MNPLLAPVPFPTRESDSHKGSLGRVLLCGGSRGMAGSIALSSMAALHTGSGLVSTAVPDRCLETVASFHACIMTIPLSDDLQGRFSVNAFEELKSKLGPFDSVGCGPGMTTSAGSQRIVGMLMNTKNAPRVFDADAINCLAAMDWNARESDDGPIVLTPHPGELERLVGISPKNREKQIGGAKELATQKNLTIVVKGAPTVVVSQQGSWTTTTGNAGMATAGSGDVLTGMIACLLGQGLSPWDAGRLGVFLHGLAGDFAAEKYGQAGMTAKELLESIPAAIQEQIL